MFSKQQKKHLARNRNSRSISTHDSVNCHAGEGVRGEGTGLEVESHGQVMKEGQETSSGACSQEDGSVYSA